MHKGHLDLKTLEKIDSGNMHSVYDRWPEIAREQFGADFEPFDCGDRRHIVFAGMGGSGAINNVFSSILSKTGVHVDVVKGYLLPRTADSDSLVVATSISGNTAETLTVLRQAKKTGCKTVAFSSGGIMRDYCGKNGVGFWEIPSHHSPRASFTSFLYSMLKILHPVLPIDGSDIAESLTLMEKLRDKIHSGNLSGCNSALDLAAWLPRIPVIYYPWGLESAAIRFKNSLQENSKMHAMAEDVIEACHNGIVSLREGGEVRPVLVRGAQDYEKTQQRWEILKELFEKKGIKYKEVFSPPGSILAKLIGLIYLFDYCSIYRAALDGTDPTPVEAINFVKKRL